MKKLLTAILTLLFAFSAVGCTGATDVAVYASKVECGKYFRIPELVGANSEEVTVSVTDPNADNVKVSRNVFQLTTVGDYKITYGYKGKSTTITVQCTPDVSAPYLENSFNVKKTYQVGEICAPDGGELADPSGVDKTRSGIRHLEFYYENETEPVATGTSLIIEKEGRYTVKLPAFDKLGNHTVYEYSFIAVKPFTDELPEGYIADFDETGYLEYLGSSGQWGDYSDEFTITSDYPNAEEDTTNQVLFAKADSNGPHYVLRMDFLNEIAAEEVKYVYLKFAMEERTGWNESGTFNYGEFAPTLYGVPYSLLDVSIAEYLAPSDGRNSDAHFFTFTVGEWTVARIPAKKLLVAGETTLKGLKLCVCGNIYIDEIWYSNEEFVDTDVEAGVLADFDEAGWLYQASKGSIGDAPALSLLLEGYPEATEGSGVLKIASKSLTSTAVADIKLFQSVNVNEYSTVKFRIYYDGRLDGVLQVKSKVVFQNYKLTNHNDERLFKHLISDSNASEYYETWRVVSVPSTVFGGYEDTFDTISVLVEGQLYIDKIWVE